MPRSVFLLFVLLAARPLGAQVISRPIALPDEARQSDVALVSFYSGGHVDREGAGLAVVNAAEQSIGYRVLANDPRAQTWLAVDLAQGAEGLVLQYSRQPLSNAKVDDDLPASLILHTFPLTGRPVQKPGDLDRVLKSKRPLGTMPVNNISIAHNPFGPSQWFMTVIEGQLKDDRKRTLQVFSVHDDSAFVELDGKWLLKSTKAQTNRGSANLASQAKPVDLSGGPRRVRYLHVQRKDASLALLGYMAGKRALPLPGSVFVHHPVATLGDARGTEEKPVVGFDAQQLDQLGYNKTIYSRWRLTPIAPAPPGSGNGHGTGDAIILRDHPAGARPEPPPPGQGPVELPPAGPQPTRGAPGGVGRTGEGVGAMHGGPYSAPFDPNSPMSTNPTSKS